MRFKKLNEADKIAFIIGFIYLVATIFPTIKKGVNFETDYMTLQFALSSTIILVFLGIIFSHLMELKPAIEMMNKQTVILLELDAAWIEGTKLIRKLKKGDKLLASNCVSWHNRVNYVAANITAMENEVHIDRLYANDNENRMIANEHSNWGIGFPWRTNLVRKVYRGDFPMLDYILAIDDMGQPDWAILWLYTAKETDPLYGFQITDKNVLQSMMRDFNSKWNYPKNEKL